MRTRIATAATGAVLVLGLAGCDGLFGGSDWSVQNALSELPATDEGSPVEVWTGDLDAATEQLGIERPESTEDPEAVMDWVGQLTGFTEDVQVPGQMFVPIAPVFRQERTADIAEFEAELGWSIVDAQWFAAMVTPPNVFSVIGGDVDESSLNPDLPEVADGVVTAGDGEDMNINQDDVTVARPLGQPLRMAVRDNMIGAAGSTDAVASWLAEDGETLAGHAALDAVAEALDDADVVGAVLVANASWALGDVLGTDDPAQVEQVRSQLEGLIPADPFDAVGAGWAMEDDTSVMTAAFHFASDDAAAAATDQMETLFAEGTSLMHGRPLSDLLVLDDADHDGRVMTLTMSAADGGSAATLWQMFTNRDVPFVHE